MYKRQIYTYLTNVEYQVKAHFEWNYNRPDLACDRSENKHYFMAKRMLERGGRRDIFLGTRECQGYVEPCTFGEGKGSLDQCNGLSFGLMFHGFSYPDETGRNQLEARFWNPVIQENGVVHFCRPEECPHVRVVKPYHPKSFTLGENFSPIETLDEEVGEG